MEDAEDKTNKNKQDGFTTPYTLNRQTQKQGFGTSVTPILFIILVLVVGYQLFKGCNSPKITPINATQTAITENQNNSKNIKQKKNSQPIHIIILDNQTKKTEKKQTP